MSIRTPEELEELAKRTLYIRLPHTIKNMDEIRELVFNEAEIRLPRQSSRHCHVVFPSVEVRSQNMKALKKKLIDNKKIFVSKPQPKRAKEIKMKKVKEKKVKPKMISKPPTVSKVTKICFIKNIPLDATLPELKALFKEAKSIAILKKHQNSSRYHLAIVKFKELKSAAAYLNNEKPLPKLRDTQLEISIDKRKQKKNRKANRLRNKQRLKDLAKENGDNQEEDEKMEDENDSDDDVNSEADENDDDEDDVDDDEAED
uniref:RRM domain-containing protein n=1 Tax=Bracon brevicornis TaxID=1563983 RepID=A0A6V7HMQ9_9HYME